MVHPYIWAYMVFSSLGFKLKVGIFAPYPEKMLNVSMFPLFPLWWSSSLPWFIFTNRIKYNPTWIPVQLLEYCNWSRSLFYDNWGKKKKANRTCWKVKKTVTVFQVSKEGCGVEGVGIFPSWFNEIKGLAIYTTQDEANTARYQKQDLTCIALSKEKATDFLKGI